MQHSDILPILNEFAFSHFNKQNYTPFMKKEEDSFWNITNIQEKERTNIPGKFAAQLIIN